MSNRRKAKEITIKHVVDDRNAGIYIETDILAKTIKIGRGMKRRRLTLWEAERLEFLLKRQIDRLNGDYPKETGEKQDEVLICTHCGDSILNPKNFCTNCGCELSSAQNENNGTA